MSKRTGYQVKITGFIVASPTDVEAMRAAIIKIDAICKVMSEDGFMAVKHNSRFMLSKEIADPAPIISQRPDAPIVVDDPLALPAALDRRHRA